MDVATTPINVSDARMTLRVELLHRKSKTSLKPPCTIIDKKNWPPNYDEVLVWRRAQLARYEADPKFLANAKAFYAKNAVAFINHWCSTQDPRNANTDKLVWMPFILFKRQEELVEFILECIDQDQPGLIEKCRTMGATWVCVAVSVWMWLFYPGVAIGWGSQDAITVDQIGNPRSIFFRIRELIERLPPVFKPDVAFSDSDIKQKVCFNPSNGASIVGEVGDNIGRGGRTRVFFEDEAAHYEHPELIEASLSENTRVPIAMSSVNGLGNLFHRKREGGLDWYPGAKLERGYTRVFVMDWSDHPEYDQAWYDEKKAFHERQGTPHVFAQEIERNYAASVQGTIIPKDWLDLCVGARAKLGIPVGGTKISALDIGDSQDGDRNAQSIIEGIELTFVDEWVARDPGVTARKAMSTCVTKEAFELQYDAAGGLGSIVKSEVNRLKDEGAMPKKLRVVPWNAGGKVLHPAERVVPDDQQSPRNKDFFMNLKAQAWWAVRTAVYKTFVAVAGGGQYDAEKGMVALSDGSEYSPDELFSIDPKLPLLHKVIKELCQATAGNGARLKLIVNKAPDGTKSPNIGDSIVMARWPMPWNPTDFASIGLGPKIFVGGVVLK